MKTLKFPLLIVAVLFFTACKDEETVAVSDDETTESAELIAASLAENTSGLVATMEDAATSASYEAVSLEGGRTSGCGYSKDTTFARTRTYKNTSVDYQYSYGYTFDCGRPMTVQTTIDYDGSYDSPRLMSENAGTGVLSITGIENSSSVYVFTGSYTRIGAYESKVRNLNSGNSTVQVTLTELQISKEDMSLVSGAGSVTITRSSTAGKEVVHTGSLTFDEQTATITINGEQYIINLETGEIEG